MGDCSSPRRLWLGMVGLTLGLAASLTSAQRPYSCDVRHSSVAGMVDVHCNCMQRLTQMNLPIAQLVVNQTGCEELGLQLSWDELETQVAPQSLLMVGANIYFKSNLTIRPWNSSLTRLEFINCIFEEIPQLAFQRLNVLEVIKIQGSTVQHIQSRAIESLPRLKSIHIVNSTIHVIQGKAFTNLQELTEMIIEESSIGEVKSNAIEVRRTAPQEVRCDTDISANSSMFLREITGRQLLTAGNLDLPDYGTKFVMFKNNISVLETNAITSEAFGFLIVGGNHIDVVQTRAFSMELYNECEISAALFVGNEFNRLEDHALTGIKGRDGMPYQTFIALSRNTFQSVARRGFILDETLSIFSVDENEFYCSCDRFDWILNGEGYVAQRDLERELVTTAACVEGGSLISFTASCAEIQPSTTTTPYPTTTTPFLTNSTLMSTNSTHRSPSSASVARLDGVLSITLAVTIAKLFC